MIIAKVILSIWSVVQFFIWVLLLGVSHGKDDKAAMGGILLMLILSIATIILYKLAGVYSW